MPLYEYKCSRCRSVFEVLQKVSDPPLKKCIQCGGAVKKTVSSPAIQFKGSGWYITDYARKAKPDSSSANGKKTEPKPSSQDEKRLSKPVDKD